MLFARGQSKSKHRSLGVGGVGGDPRGHEEANDCSFSGQETKFGVEASIWEQRRKERLRTS